MNWLIETSTFDVKIGPIHWIAAILISMLFQWFYWRNLTRESWVTVIVCGVLFGMLLFLVAIALSAFGLV